MNRQEFSAKLVKIKNKAHVKLKDSLPYALQLNQNKVNALEKATFEYVMGNVFIYLKMCGTSMELIGKNVTYSTDNTDGLRKAIIAMRKSAGLSIRELAKQSSSYISVLEAFEDGRCDLRIDTFLKLVDTLDMEIKIE